MRGISRSFPTTQRDTLRKRFLHCVSVLAMCAVLGAPQVAHAVDTAGNEGDTIEFTITLGVAPNGWAVRYAYTTEDNSAVQIDDYDATSGTVTFNSGVKEQKIYVDTVDDNIEEDSEDFKLKLSDQQVNGLYNVTGWITPTDQIRGMPRTISKTGQILDNDQSTK